MNCITLVSGWLAILIGVTTTGLAIKSGLRNRRCKVQVQNPDTTKLNDPKAVVAVCNHWSRDRYVVLKLNDAALKIHEGAYITVNGRDLITAIENAMKINLR